MASTLPALDSVPRDYLAEARAVEKGELQPDWTHYPYLLAMIEILSTLNSLLEKTNEDLRACVDQRDALLSERFAPRPSKAKTKRMH